MRRGEPILCSYRIKPRNSCGTTANSRPAPSGILQGGAKILCVILVLQLFALPRSGFGQRIDDLSTGAGAIHVGKNIQVSLANPSLHHEEAVLAIDPFNAMHFLVC
jgi:hypothetical protein